MVKVLTTKKKSNCEVMDMLTNLFVTIISRYTHILNIISYTFTLHNVNRELCLNKAGNK